MSLKVNIQLSCWLKISSYILQYHCSNKLATLFSKILVGWLFCLVQNYNRKGTFRLLSNHKQLGPVWCAHLGRRKQRSTTQPRARNTSRNASSTSVLAHSGRLTPCVSRITSTGICVVFSHTSNLDVGFAHLFNRSKLLAFNNCINDLSSNVPEQFL